MLEAVNSVLQTAPLVKANAEQVSTTESFAANPNRVQKAPEVPYLSPYFAVDSSAHVVLQIRDPQTGKVLESYPSSREQQERNSTQQSAIHAPVRSSSTASAHSAPAPSSSSTGRQIAAFTAASHAASGSSTGSHISLEA